MADWPFLGGIRVLILERGFLKETGSPFAALVNAQGREDQETVASAVRGRMSSGRAAGLPNDHIEPAGEVDERRGAGDV